VSARACATLLLALAGLPVSAQAGEIIRFEAGPQTRTDVVLQNVPLKALVTEFLDPDDSGIGKSAGYLVWREILTAISDQAGAGVILARAPGDERLTDLLEHEYHDAAVRIAREQSASMAVWGAVSATGDNIYVSTYLSLLPEAAGLALKLRLSGMPPLPPGLEAEIGRTNYNFPPVEISRADLFERRLVTRKEATVRETAGASSKALARFPAGKILDSMDMDKGWFQVRLAGGKTGYVDNSVVDVPPRTVEAARVATALQDRPGGRRVRTVTLDGAYRVLDMRYVASKGLWYELEVGQVRGWVPATAVRARFSLPIVHFVAGLYRYQFKRYEDARREFAQYIAAPDSRADNASLASAYQLLGASTLMTKQTVFQADDAALNYFSNAVEATPYDPAAYSLRALSTLAVRRELGGALADLEQALKLDANDAGAMRIARTIDQSLRVPEGNARTLVYMLRDAAQPGTRERLQTLASRYLKAEPR
jgi:tetratricopeptide (TPR) repeat protein